MRKENQIILKEDLNNLTNLKKWKVLFKKVENFI